MVNEVLQRLRESTVSSVTTNAYSTLIGRLVNDSKRAVEDAWNWDALSITIPLNTVGSTSNYVVTGSGRRHKDVTINDTTNRIQLRNVPIQWIINQQQLSTVQQGNPVYYAWNGTNGTDSKIELYPTPNGVFTLQVSMYVPQADLSSDADIVMVPYEAITLGAYARAIVERGEDGGLNSSEAYQLYKNCLADQISIEASRFVENSEWIAA
jgi:hypothetical protein